MRVVKAPSARRLFCLLSPCVLVCAFAQTPSTPAPADPQTSPAQTMPAPASPAPATPAHRPKVLKHRSLSDPNAPALTPEQTQALRGFNMAVINGRPYQQPTRKDIFKDYVSDSYGLPAVARTMVRTLYSEGRDKPSSWGQDFPGFMQRFGANAGQTIVSGNARYAMEAIFHEDLRYFPCHGCSIKAKIENSLLAEITARHDTDGHRFFTLTPTIADFSGPIVAHTLWYPGGPNPGAGAVSARLAFATRIGAHLFREFVLERRHKDPNREDDFSHE